MEHKSYNQSVVKQAGGSCRVGKDDKCAQLSRIQCIRYVPQRQMESALTYRSHYLTNVIHSGEILVQI